MHASQTSTDAAVIRASRLDPAAFGVVFDRHWVRIHRYCVVRAGPPGEDVAAETFRVAFDRRSEYDGRADAAPWLTCCATGFARPPAGSGRCAAALWMNCMDALEGGAGRPDIRAGAMLALSTLPDVKVTQTSLGGQAGVQITNTQFSDNYAETLDLDARSGVLVHMSGGTVGKPDSVDVSYRVTRVTAPSLDAAH